MLLNLYKKKWNQGVKLEKFDEHAKDNETKMKEMTKLADDYSKRIDMEMKKTKTEIVVSTIGKVDPKKHLTSNVEDLMGSNILQSLGMMTNTKTFWLFCWE